MGVHVLVGDEWIDVRLDGLERVLALSRGVQLPLRAVRSARVVAVDEVAPERGWRIPGTAVPGLVVAGSYSWRGEHEGGRQLWCVQRDREVLVIDLDPDAGLAYDRVVLQHPDRHDLAWWIGERVVA